MTFSLPGGAVKDAAVDQNFRALGAEVNRLGTLKSIRGIVNTAGAGSIVEGAGFSIKRNGVGDITITFTTAFADVPTVVCSAGETAGEITAKLFTSAPTSSTARVATFNTGTGALVDSLFHFIATGPR